MIYPGHALPLSRQSRILGLSRSSLYYKSVPISDRDLMLMRLIDEIHLKYPFYGVRRIRNELRDLGHDVGRGHVSTLMRRMGIRALYQKPRLSVAHPDHKVYPYLLRGVEISRANHCWAADVTYIPMARGFCYLVAIMDWASRRVMAWRLSNTLDASFCVEALEEAIRKYGAPEIFNTDQGSQFTSEAFIDTLKAHGIKISMDSKGRWMDRGGPHWLDSFGADLRWKPPAIMPPVLPDNLPLANSSTPHVVSCRPAKNEDAPHYNV